MRAFSKLFVSERWHEPSSIPTGGPRGVRRCSTLLWAKTAVPSLWLCMSQESCKCWWGERTLISGSTWTCGMKERCLWSWCNIWRDARGILCRQGRTTGELSSFCKSMELWATAVERWCTLDVKKQQVEMSGFLLMGVSHRQCISMNWECVCVCVCVCFYNMTL